MSGPPDYESRDARLWRKECEKWEARAEAAETERDRWKAVYRTDTEMLEQGRKAAEAALAFEAERYQTEHGRRVGIEQQLVAMKARATAAEARVRVLKDALRAMDALVVQAQKITTEILIGQPRGLSDKAGLSALIELLDGPEQRAAQGLARTALGGQS